MIELRCPVSPRRMFAKVDEGDEGIIEVACDSCRRDRRKQGQTDVVLVLHQFTMDGRCVETIVSEGLSR